MASGSGEGCNLVLRLREAVRQSGLTLRELARRSGVSQPQISRFVNGERSLTLDSAEKLLNCLGFQIIYPHSPPPPAPRKGRRKGGG
jgi:transcriptional regulator with XRE-family HTH domain